MVFYVIPFGLKMELYILPHQKENMAHLEKYSRSRIRAYFETRFGSKDLNGSISNSGMKKGVILLELIWYNLHERKTDF